jgi:class 3 adenylate cyclase/tetratricopeptide (TPR) repeat protein
VLRSPDPGAASLPTDASTAGLISYLPRIWLRQLAAKTTSGEGPFQLRMEAAVLLVDLSGFTHLTEQFGMRGAAGAEHLSRILNSYFGETTDTIVAHGGDVLFFAGDSVVAMWEAKPDLSAAIRRAAQCALTVQAHPLSVEASSDVRLRRHTAIGAGALSLLELGGFEGRWHVLFAGPAIRQLEAALQHSESGDVVLSSTAWNLVRDSCRADVSWRGDAKLKAVTRFPPPEGPVPIPDPHDLADVIRSHVPALIMDRWDSGLEDWLAEFRDLSLIFLSLAEVDPDDRESVSRLQSAFQCVQREIARYEGSLYQFRADEKGVSAIAAFGLPARSHEDNALRALEAATEISRELKGFALQSAAGVTSGQALCGVCGSEARRQYTILGSVINRASRLMQVATDDVVCDEATARAAGRRAVLVSLPDITLKGLLEPIRIFRPEGIVRGRGKEFTHKILGREPERRQLSERLRQVRNGTGSCTIVQGEAGIGKSRLLADLADQARLHGVNVFWGEGDAIEHKTPYYPWRAVVARILDPTSEAPAEQIREQLLARLEGDARLASWAPLLNEIVSVGVPDNEITAAMESTARANGTHELLIHLLEDSASRAPTLLVLDDAHWFDSNSLVLTMAVMRRIANLMIVVGTRPPADPAPPSLRSLVAVPEAHLVDLKNLPGDVITSLVKQRLGVEALPKPVTEFICSHAEGHPFLAEELGLVLRDTGHIAIENGECRIVGSSGRFDTASLPTTIQAVIVSRIDQLSSSEQVALKTASVIGRTFPYRLLHDVLPIEQDRGRLAELLQALERQDLTYPEAVEPEQTYVFKHVIGRDVVYNTMLSSQRQPLHRAIAEWLERNYPDELPPRYAILAYHWEQAGELARTLDYLENAGERALLGFSNHEVLAFLTKAAEISDRTGVAIDPRRRSGWERSLGEAYLKLSDDTTALPHLVRSLELRGHRVPKSRVTLSLDLAAQLGRQIAHRMLGGRVAHSSQRDRERREFEAGVYMRLAEAAFFRNERLRLLAATLRSLNAGESAGSTAHMISGFSTVAVMLGLTGLHALARRYAGRALELAERQGTLADRAFARVLLGNYWVSVGDWSSIEDFSTSAADAFFRLGDRFRFEMCLGQAGWAAFFQGAFARASAAFTRQYDSARIDGALASRVWGRSGQLASVMSQGERHVPFLSELEEFVQKAPNPAELIMAAGLLSLVRLRRGESALALEWADRALVAMTEGVAQWYLTLPIAAVAEVYLSVCEASGESNRSVRKELRSKARGACRALRRLSFSIPIARPNALLANGLLQWLEGRHGRARSLWRQSTAAAERLGMRYEQGLGEFELGRHLGLGDPERGEHLERALTIFTALGAHHDVSRTRKLLEAA